jgi:hypothetical protein
MKAATAQTAAGSGWARSKRSATSATSAATSLLPPLLPEHGYEIILYTNMQPHPGNSTALQVERARKMARTDGADDDAAPVNTDLQRSEADEPIKLSLAASSGAAAAAAAAAAGDGKAAAAAARSRPAPLFGDDDGELVLGAVGMDRI